VAPTTTTTAAPTTTTTGPPGPDPTCGAGDGIPNSNPSKPPKNAGLLKISKGLLSTPAAKNTKFTFSGTVEDCINMAVQPKTGTPISAGSLKLQVTLPPGSTCSNTGIGLPVKVTGQVKWTAIKPSTGKPTTIFTDKFKSLASYGRVGSGFPITIDAVSAPLSNVKSPFNGDQIAFHFVLDENSGQVNTLCSQKNGITQLHFTNLAGQSTVTVI
jgi:hypothetical protein